MIEISNLVEFVKVYQEGLLLSGLFIVGNYLLIKEGYDIYKENWEEMNNIYINNKQLLKDSSKYYLINILIQKITNYNKKWPSKDIHHLF